MAKNSNGQMDQIKENIKSLEGEMNGLNDILDLNPESMFPDDGLLPGLNDIEIFDYQKELESIKLDSEETLDCLSSLYLSTTDIEKRNINNIIMNDSDALADLKFSVFCSKRGLINLMTQIDMGINDPMMYQSVGSLQKEIRDTIKMIYDIQKKMKDFYKDIRTELSEINTGEVLEGEEEVDNLENEDDVYHIIDYQNLNDELDDYKKTKDDE